MEWDGTYEGQGVAQQDEARGMLWQLVGELCHVGVDVVIGLLDFERCLIDLILLERVRALAESGHGLQFAFRAVAGKRSYATLRSKGSLGSGDNMGRTDYGLRVLSPRCA